MCVCVRVIYPKKRRDIVVFVVQVGKPRTTKAITTYISLFTLYISGDLKKKESTFVFAYFVRERGIYPKCNKHVCFAP